MPSAFVTDWECPFNLTIGLFGGPNQLNDLRQVLLLHDLEVVSALVQIEVLPPCWATLQSLVLLCV